MENPDFTQPDEERELVRTTIDDRKALIEQNLPFVHKLVNVYRERLSRHGLESEDLFQEGCIGLMDAAGRYDPTRDSSFSHFAGRRIIGSMIDAVRNASPLTRGQMDNIDAWQEMEDRLSQELYRTPEVREIAGHLGLDEETAEATRIFMDWQTPASIDAPLPILGSEPVSFHEVLTDEQVENENEVVARLHHQDVADRCLKKLTEKQKHVVLKNVVEEVPLRVIGDGLGVVESRASQIKSVGLKRMKQLYVAKEAA